MSKLLDLVGKAKLEAKNRIDAEKASLKFRANTELERLYFSIPPKRKLIEMAARVIIDQIVNQLLKKQLNKATLNYYIRTDPLSKEILNNATAELNNDILSNTLLACYNELPEYNIPEIDENLSENQVFDFVDAINDIDSKIDYNKIGEWTKGLASMIINKEHTLSDINSRFDQIKVLEKNFLGTISDAVKAEINAGIEQLKAEIDILQERLKTAWNDIKQKIKSFFALLQHIISMIKDLFTKTDHPSKYRTKYIQKLIRNLYGLIKVEIKTASEQYKPILQNLAASLKSLDTILITLAIFTATYLLNRKKLSKASTKTLNEISEDITCKSVPDAFDVSVNIVPLQINLMCPEIIDDVVVPHMPLTIRLDSFSCPTSPLLPPAPESGIKQEIATTAIVQNNRKSEKFSPIISVDSMVTQQTVIAKLDQTLIYSPVDGKIEAIEDNKIVIADISEPLDYLSEQINLLNEKYERLNNVKAFIKDYLVDSLYPSMIAVSTLDNKTTRNTDKGVDDEWKDIKKNYEKDILKKYEKNIKKITGKDNVEKHAKNETLDEIKKEVEKEENALYKNIELLQKRAYGVAKTTKTQSREYDLFEYYMFDLALKLNAIENPNAIEIIFRDEINSYVDKRYVLEGFNKKKLEARLTDQIKYIEKGLSGSYNYKDIVEVYNRRKSLEDLKDWLTTLINKNNKIDAAEKIVDVKRVLFLFEYYLNVDKLVQKYNTIKKETSPKQETIKEGSWLKTFFQNLWKEYGTLRSEIKDIQEIIDSLSLISTYTIISYNDKPARLYSICEESTCESKETDPYMNPKSKYGYGDIQYWLKYCAYATLAGVVNPLSWSTGWIFPAPILFPVVYVPIKPIETRYGVILLGLTICGIYIFPFSLFVNYSNNYTLPFADPVGMVKNEINEIKRQITLQTQNLKKIGIKTLMDDVKKDVLAYTENVNNYKKSLIDHKKKKPAKYVSLSSEQFKIMDVQKGVQANINYAEQYQKWLTGFAEYEEIIIKEQLKLWQVETKYKILHRAYTVGTPVKGVSDNLDKMEETITAQFDKLNVIIDNANKLLATLPISIDPQSANFGFTLKNPKPVINIAGELDDNVNDSVLNPIIERYKLTNALTIASNIENRIDKTVLNYKVYKQALIASMPLIINKDPFPKYELLSPLNVQWLKFLAKDFTMTGAKTYGFPGQLPLPISI